jgi:hypothetical protein
MAVVSDGKHYGIPEGLVFSFPCTCSNGDYTIVGGMIDYTIVGGMIDYTIVGGMIDYTIGGGIILYVSHAP